MAKDLNEIKISFAGHHIKQDNKIEYPTFQIDFRIKK